MQNAVKILEQQKNDYLKLEESAMLLDRETECPREVDIVLRGQINGHSIIVSVEVRDRKRPADSPWVEQMLAKHECLLTNKLILVSASGFSKAALQKAKAKNVDAVDASGVDHVLKSYLEKAAFIKRDMIQVIAEINDEPIPIDSILKIGSKSAPVKDHIISLLAHSEIKKLLSDSPSGIIIEAGVEFSVDGVESTSGQMLQFAMFIVTQDTLPVKFSTITYDEGAYIYGEFDGPKAGCLVTDIYGKLIGHEYKT